MNKKIIIAIAVMLAVAVVFCACENKKYKEVDRVTGDDGKEIVIYEDEDGSKYIDNKDGDKVPVTQSPDGFYDDLNSIVEDSTADKKNDNEEKPSGEIIIGDASQGEASIDWDDIATVS